MPRAKNPRPDFSEGQRKFKSSPELPGAPDPQARPGRPRGHSGGLSKAMQVKEGDRLMARVVDGELRLITPEMAIKRAQKWCARRSRTDDSLVGRPDRSDAGRSPTSSAMAEVVLDSSAILAVLRAEPGAEQIAAVMPRSLVSVVNEAEVITVLIRQRKPPEQALSSCRAAVQTCRSGRRLGAIAPAHCGRCEATRSVTSATAAASRSRSARGFRC